MDVADSIPEANIMMPLGAGLVEDHELLSAAWVDPIKTVESLLTPETTLDDPVEERVRHLSDYVAAIASCDVAVLPHRPAQYTACRPQAGEGVSDGDSEATCNLCLACQSALKRCIPVMSGRRSCVGREANRRRQAALAGEEKHAKRVIYGFRKLRGAQRQLRATAGPPLLPQ